MARVLLFAGLHFRPQVFLAFRGALPSSASDKFLAASVSFSLPSCWSQHSSGKVVCLSSDLLSAPQIIVEAIAWRLLALHWPAEENLDEFPSKLEGQFFWSFMHLTLPETRNCLSILRLSQQICCKLSGVFFLPANGPWDIWEPSVCKDYAAFTESARSSFLSKYFYLLRSDYWPRQTYQS